MAKSLNFKSKKMFNLFGGIGFAFFLLLSFSPYAQANGHLYTDESGFERVRIASVPAGRKVPEAMKHHMDLLRKYSEVPFYRFNVRGDGHCLDYAAQLDRDVLITSLQSLYVAPNAGDQKVS